MADTVAAVRVFLDIIDPRSLNLETLDQALETLCCSGEFRDLITSFVYSPVFSPEMGQNFAAAGIISGLTACRKLRSCLNLPLDQLFDLLVELFEAFDGSIAAKWRIFSSRVRGSELRHQKLMDYLLSGSESQQYQQWIDQLVETHPHAVYPTSCYRESQGHVVSTADDQIIEAVMSSSTFTSIRVMENVLDPQQTILRDMYLSLGRCVCLIDMNVEQYYGEQIESYFDYHEILLQKLIYRAMEVDKGIGTVERMLGDLKRLGVSRNEPVLVVGGGVLADTAGLACALYHRNTPYVMLSTSLVSGIDAGPSPRTCCDGFGYKNLFGAYHAPVLALTDRTFFKTLRPGWLRHGVAEIIKMSVVKDAQLFQALEQAGRPLIETRFGTLDCGSEDEISQLSKQILAAAMRSYVEAEYDNLYETHQCRPHAYGHTWSPGFEIRAGLLHGHAVSIGMGFGAYLSYRLQWISEEDLHRILSLISSFDLSLWHDVLWHETILWSAQEKIVQKRGGNLVAPLPKGRIGRCGYLNSLTRVELRQAIEQYQLICAGYPRQGLGLEPLCRDVGLEDPSTMRSLPHEPVSMLKSLTITSRD